MSKFDSYSSLEHSSAQSRLINTALQRGVSSSEKAKNVSNGLPTRLLRDRRQLLQRRVKHLHGEARGFVARRRNFDNIFPILTNRRLLLIAIYKPAMIIRSWRERGRSAMQACVDRLCRVAGRGVARYLNR